MSQRSNFNLHQSGLEVKRPIQQNVCMCVKCSSSVNILLGLLVCFVYHTDMHHYPNNMTLNIRLSSQPCLVIV